MSEIAMSLPFSIDPYGKVSSTTDQKKIWADKVRSVLGTALRERVMLPTFGTLIPYALFENDTEAVAEIKAEVERAFNEHLRLLNLTQTSVSLDQYTNVLTVNVVYGLPNTEVTNTTIGLILIDGTTPAYEEFL
jgi:phage baseplate assembly protein W